MTVTIQTRTHCIQEKCKGKGHPLAERFEVVMVETRQERYQRFSSHGKITKKNRSHKLESKGLWCEWCRVHHPTEESNPDAFRKKGYTNNQVVERLKYSSYFFGSVPLFSYNPIQLQLFEESDDPEMFKGTLYVKTPQLWMVTPLIATHHIKDPSIGYVMAGKSLEDIHSERNCFLVEASAFIGVNRKEKAMVIHHRELKIFG